MTATVGICAHNEEDTIGHLLGQVRSSDAPVDQIIVVVAGDDRTGTIVRQHQQEDQRIELVDEGERRGQSAAQNEILERATGETILLVDGDGWLGDGDLETIEQATDPDTIAYGRETPVTPSTYTGRVIDAFWEIHDRLSRRSPKFTTQLAGIPAGLIEKIPEEVVIDDEFIGRRAQQDGLAVRYCPDARKYHNITGDIRSFIRHRRKNWAGMIQLERRYGVGPMQTDTSKAYEYIRYMFDARIDEVLPLLTLGAIEAYSYLGAQLDIRVFDDPPYIWER